jgi:hypothetical protein
MINYSLSIQAKSIFYAKSRYPIEPDLTDNRFDRIQCGLAFLKLKAKSTVEIILRDASLSEEVNGEDWIVPHLKISSLKKVGIPEFIKAGLMINSHQIPIEATNLSPPKRPIVTEEDEQKLAKIQKPYLRWTPDQDEFLTKFPPNSLGAVLQKAPNDSKEFYGRRHYPTISDNSNDLGLSSQSIPSEQNIRKKIRKSNK